MASPGQKRGGCGHLMAGSDSHRFYLRCRNKGNGPDPYISYSDCNSCNVLTSDQHTQLSTPSYKLKKEKCEFKKAEKTDTSASTTMDTDSSCLVDLVSVVGVVNGQGTSQAPSLSVPKDKQKKVSSSEEKPASKPAKSSSDKLAKSVSDSRSAMS